MTLKKVGLTAASPLCDKIPSVNYQVTLTETEEGWAVSCPSLAGCHSQGGTREEALSNIKEAIKSWLEVQAEENGIKQVQTTEVVV